MSELDPRKETVLRAVVFEYIEGAEPVASEIIARKYELGVKSATIRNVLAELSDQGYLEQPHTSAGRVPSDTGYRYFVDRLMPVKETDPAVRQQVRAASADGEALQELVSETTRVLSRLTHLLSAATIIRDQSVQVRSVIVNALGPQQAMVLVVLANGHVAHKMIEIPAGLTLTELGSANEVLLKTVQNQSLRALGRSKPPSVADSPATERLLASIWGAIRLVSKEINRVSVTTQGEEFLFAEPEFQRDAGLLCSILEELKGNELFADALSSPGDKPQTVTIGKENKLKPMHPLSVVRQRFYIGSNEAGVIALIGPTRMSYDESIPLVDYTAKALSEALTKFFG